MLVLAWSPDGRYIATGNQDSTIQFWNIASGKELQMWGYPAKIRELAWDCRSRYLASGGASSVVVWDCSGKGPAGTKPVMLEFHEERLTQLAFQSEGKTLASGCNEGWVSMWRPGNGRKPLGVMHLGAAVTQLTWSPSNRRLAAASDGGRVAVFRAPKG
jgi:WD40 repeat protein